jgi:Carbon starvation protein CstA
VRTKSRTRTIVIRTAVGLVGAVAWAVIALGRGEEISAAWLIAAALGSYAIAYRFYARFIAKRVLGVDDKRATPAERLENDIDYQPTDRRVLFGHHFAAIAGAGPLVGPVLAALRPLCRAHAARPCRPAGDVAPRLRAPPPGRAQREPARPLLLSGSVPRARCC